MSTPNRPTRGGPPRRDKRAGPPRRGFQRDDRNGPPRRDFPHDDRSGPPRRDFHRDDRNGPPRRDFQRDDRNGPPRRDFHRDDRNGPPRRDFQRDDRNGPPRRDFQRDDRDGPPRRDFQRDDRNGPPRRDFQRDDRDGPPRRDFHRDDRNGPPRRDFQRDDRDGPPRRDFQRDDRDGPPRRDFQRDDRNGPPRRDFQRDDRDGPPRRDFQRDDRNGPPRRDFQRDDRNGPPRRDFQRDASAAPGSRGPHDAGTTPATPTELSKSAPPHVGRFRRSADFDEPKPPLAPRSTEAVPRKRSRKSATPEQKLGAAAHAWFCGAPRTEAPEVVHDHLPARDHDGIGGREPGDGHVPAGVQGDAQEEVHAHAHGRVNVHDNAHAHAHAHDHADASAHGNGRAPGRAPAPPLAAALLERGAGVGQLLFLDCPSGISGDMTVAALLDLGVPAEVVDDALAALPLDGYRIERERLLVGPLAATTFRVHAADASDHRRYAAIDGMLAAAPLDEPVRLRARRIFARLAEAEATVHGLPVDEVTFHEVGAVDSIVDIVAVAACLAFIGASLAVSPLPIGRGLVATQHGPLPLPAPATLLCLRGVPTYGVDFDGELVTPTGAAIVGALADQYVRWPRFVPERVGVGAGQRNFPDRPNVLRAVLGEPSAEATATAALGSHVVLEANVDDLTGELAGHALEALLEAGALDAWLTPVTMKKGRPGLVLGAVAHAADLDRLAAVVLAQTSTIGLRYYPIGRVEQARQTVVVPTEFGPLPVKVSTGAGAPAHVKPEFDACRAAAAEHGVPVRAVIAEALAAYQRGGAASG